MRTFKVTIGFIALMLGIAFLVLTGGLVDGTGTLQEINRFGFLAIANTVGGYIALRTEGAL